MSAIYGVRGSGDWASPDEAPHNYHETLFKLYGEEAPFYALLSKLGSDEVDSPIYHVFEEELPQMYGIVDGIHTDVDTTITLKSPGSTPCKAFKVGDLLRVQRTGEIVRVVTAPSDPWLVLTVATRGSWGGGNVALADNDELRWVGSAYEEATTAPDGISQDISAPYNYVEDFRDAAEISNIADVMEVRPEPAWKREKRLASLRHMLKIESALFYGKRVATTGSNGKPLRGTGGLDYWITTNVFDYSSTGVSMDNLEDACETIFKYGSKTKWAFCGPGAITKLQRMVRLNSASNFDLGKPAETRSTYGLLLREFFTNAGRLQLFPEPLFAESTSWTNLMWVVDPKFVKAVYLRKIGRTKWYDNIKTDDHYTGKKGEWETIMGLRLAQEKVHSQITMGTIIP